MRNSIIVFLKLMFLWFVISFEGVIGMPFIFLVMLGSWFGNCFNSKKNDSDCLIHNVIGLVFGSYWLAVVFNAKFSIFLVVLIAHFMIYYYVSGVLRSEKWRWLITSVFTCGIIAVYLGYSLGFGLMMQLIVSFIFYLLVMRLNKDWQKSY